MYLASATIAKTDFQVSEELCDVLCVFATNILDCSDTPDTYES